MKSQEVKDLMEAYASIYEQADERSPEYSRKKQEAAKEAAQKAREARKAAKPQSAIEREGAVDRRTQQLGREAMRRAGIGNPHASGDLHNSADLFDIVKGYLVSEGATEEEVHDMMAHLTAEQVEAIVEGYGKKKKKK